MRFKRQVEQTRRLERLHRWYRAREIERFNTYGAMSTMFAGYSREVRCADITRYSPERAPDRKSCYDQATQKVEVTDCCDGVAFGRAEK